MTNTVSPKYAVLMARYGMYIHPLINLCQHHGLDVRIIGSPWSSRAPAEKFADALAADTDHEIKAVLVTHNETVPWVRSDMAAKRRVMDASVQPAILFVDCTNSLPSMPFDYDD